MNMHMRSNFGSPQVNVAGKRLTNHYSIVQRITLEKPLRFQELANNLSGASTEKGCIWPVPSKQRSEAR